MDVECVINAQWKGELAIILFTLVALLDPRNLLALLTQGHESLECFLLIVE